MHYEHAPNIVAHIALCELPQYPNCLNLFTTQYSNRRDVTVLYSAVDVSCLGAWELLQVVATSLYLELLFDSLDGVSRLYAEVSITPFLPPSLFPYPFPSPSCVLR